MPNPSDHSEWLTVSEVAEIEGVSTETVRRGISAFKYPAQRASDAPRAPWLINAAAYERRRKAEAERIARRERLAGTVSAFDNAEFDRRMEEVHGRDAMEQVRQLRERRELFERAERDMYEGPDAPTLRQRFEQLDEAERFEAEARELAQRTRRAERLRERALEILEGEDEGE